MEILRYSVAGRQANGWILIGPKRNKENSAKKEILHLNAKVNRICAIFSVSAETAQNSALQVLLIDSIRLRFSKLHPLKMRRLAGHIMANGMHLGGIVIIGKCKYG